MDNNFYSREILNEDDLRRIREQFETIQFCDGIHTLTGNPFENVENNHKMKNCLNDTSDIENQKIASIIYAALDRDRGFYKFSCPEKTNSPIISRTEVGGYYRAHHDDGMIGDYSTTVFLNDPSEYEGGELRLKLGSGVETFKMPAGHAVTYSTGIPHEVSEVTSGCRDVAVFWTTAKFADHALRDIHRDLLYLQERLDEVLPGKAGYPSIEEASEDPSFLVEQIIHKMIRRYRRTS